jgi:cysteinyl-tRNA synthetase
MLKLYNTLGKKIERFHPVNKKVINIFTCGPSVYQRAHIGNFRTFLFEDILVRYLEYSGYRTKRGMNFTDIEDKSIMEAEKRKTTVKHLTEKNISEFIYEVKALEMKIPDYLPKASESIQETVEIIESLLKNGTAYWHKGNVYFDPLKFPEFGKLYGLDMSGWPSKRKRFHKDTYPGIQWNMGDFILWHGYTKGKSYYCDTSIGKGRPSWNIQDPAMVSKYFNETLSVYCGGIDNLFRHHDYTKAILESVRPYPMAKYWLHCQHLYVNGQKMSKSKGNVLYTDSLQRLGYAMAEIRFFLIYGHYRERMNYSKKQMGVVIEKLRSLKTIIKKIKHRADMKPGVKSRVVQSLRNIFSNNMDNDLNVKRTFDGLYSILSSINVDTLKPAEAAGITAVLIEIDEVFKVIF